MSSTNRGAQRSPADFYITPPWVVDRLMEERSKEGTPLRLPAGRWLEPCAGNGELVRAVNARVPGVDWTVAELRPEMGPFLTDLAPSGVHLGDFLEMSDGGWGDGVFDVAITNPPFRLALPIIHKCFGMAKTVVMLQRLNFLGSALRHEWMQTHVPDTYVIPDRVMFSLNKDNQPGADSIEYAWFVWDTEKPSRTGQVRILDITPKADRIAWKNEIILRAAA